MIESKAIEIYDSFKKIIDCDYPETLNNQIVRCAVLNVDLIISFGNHSESELKYWQAVRKQLTDRYE